MRRPWPSTARSSATTRPRVTGRSLTTRLSPPPKRDDRTPLPACALLRRSIPTDSRYQIALGRILTYNPKTRSEGRQLSRSPPRRPAGHEALRQSLVWDSQNPASGPEIRAYLAKHNDPQLAEALRNQPKPSAATAATNTAPTSAPASAHVRTSTSATAPSVPVEDSPEVLADRAKGSEMEAAYNALNAKHLEEAEARFKAILANDPAQPARARRHGLRPHAAVQLRRRHQLPRAGQAERCQGRRPRHRARDRALLLHDGRRRRPRSTRTISPPPSSSIRPRWPCAPPAPKPSKASAAPS